MEDMQIKFEKLIALPLSLGAYKANVIEAKEISLDRAFREDEAQGYIVDVYEDKAVFSGVNFFRDELYPLYTYTIKR